MKIKHIGNVKLNYRQLERNWTVMLHFVPWNITFYYYTRIQCSYKNILNIDLDHKVLACIAHNLLGHQLNVEYMMFRISFLLQAYTCVDSSIHIVLITLPDAGNMKLNYMTHCSPKIRHQFYQPTRSSCSYSNAKYSKYLFIISNIILESIKSQIVNLKVNISEL